MTYYEFNTNSYYEIKLKTKNATLTSDYEEYILTIDPIDYAISKIEILRKAALVGFCNYNCLSNLEYNYKKNNNYWIPINYNIHSQFKWLNKYNITDDVKCILTSLNYNKKDIENFLKTAKKINKYHSIKEESNDISDDSFCDDNNFLPIEDKLKEEIEMLLDK